MSTRHKAVMLIAVIICSSFVLPVTVIAGTYSVLRPASESQDLDVKKISPSMHKKMMQMRWQGELERGPSGPNGIIDTLTWRNLGASNLVNLGFLNPCDSMLVWLRPAAACSLISVRFRPINWEGTILLDIWNASNYDPLIHSWDSTDANGWLGSFEPIDDPGGWVPGDIVGHSPLGWSPLDPEGHYWGPFPYTITAAHADVWIEVPAAYGLQGEIDLGRDPFYIGTNFYITQGWGFYAQYDWTTPYNFFKFYSACCGPDGLHDGWFIRSYFMWFEAIVKYYENIPPTFSNIRVQNYTYAPGPFPITVIIQDLDYEDETRAGIASAELVYDINGVVGRTPMEGPEEGGLFTGDIPELTAGDVVTYWIEAFDLAGLESRSNKVHFARIEPEHPGADILLIWDYSGDEEIDTFFVDLFASLETKYEYELWNNPAMNGIDASVIDHGWNTIYISGWGCGNTLPGFEYEGDPFVQWLEAGTPDEPHNILYIDQDYFCIQDDYGCAWDEELKEGDFMYDYFGVALAISDNHGSLVAGYDSVAIGEEGTEFEGLRMNFNPTAWWPAGGATTPPENALWPDWLIELTGDAEQIFYYKDTEFGAGVRLDRGHYRTVFLPWADFFAVDSLENGDLVPRPELVETVERILSWFGTGRFRGDLNGDGFINIVDVLLVVNHILGIHRLESDDFWLADCDGNGQVNLQDAFSLVNVILGVGQCAPMACRPELTVEVMEFLESLESYLSPEDFARFMALVKAEVQVPDEYSLAQNYPNPFNPTTDIRYQISDSRLPIRTTMKIYNILGQEVRVLVDELKEPGLYTATWDGLDNTGHEVSSGVYFYRMRAGDQFTATKRMVLLK